MKSLRNTLKNVFLCLVFLPLAVATSNQRIELLSISYSRLSSQSGIALSLNNQDIPCSFSCHSFVISPSVDEDYLYQVPGLNRICILNTDIIFPLSVYYECIGNDYGNSTVFYSNTLRIQDIETSNSCDIQFDSIGAISNSSPFESLLECSERVSLNMDPYVLCRIKFIADVTQFDDKYLIVKDGSVVFSTMLYHSSEYSIALSYISISSSSAISCQLLYGAAFDTTNRVSGSSGVVEISLSQSSFGVSITQITTVKEACYQRFFVFMIATSVPVIGIPTTAISLPRSSIQRIVRETSQQFKLYVTCETLNDFSVSVYQSSIYDFYHNTNRPSGILTVSADCSIPVITGDTDYFFDFFSFDITLNCSTEIGSLNRSVVTMNKEIIWTHVAKDHSITLSFYLRTIKNVVATLGEGFVTSVSGKLSSPFSFTISVSNDPLSLVLTYRNSFYHRLIYVDFVFSMNVAKDGLMDYIQIDNGVAGTLTFDGLSGSFAVSPKNNNNMTVTFHNNINGTYLLDRCGNKLDKDYSLSIPVESSIPVVYLYSECKENCVSPAVIHIVFSKRMKELKASYVQLSKCKIMLMNHVTDLHKYLADGVTTDSDVYIAYVTPISNTTETASIRLPYSVIQDETGNYNMESNTVTLSFRQNDKSISSLTSDYTNTNPYEVFLLFADPVSRVFDDKLIAVNNCKVLGITLVTPTQLRVVVRIESEGVGSFTLPRGLTIGRNGLINEEFTWEFSYDTSQPEGVLSCSSNIIRKTPITCYLTFSKEVEDANMDCLVVSDNGMIESFQKNPNDPSSYTFLLNGRNVGLISLYLKENSVNDLYGNWNIQSNTLSIFKDSVEFIPVLSSPYTTNPYAYSPFYIPVLVQLPVPANTVDSTKIIVTNGIISDLVQSNSQWSFYISPFHQSKIVIECLGGAFMDVDNRLSEASQKLVLDVWYETTDCVFLGPTIARELSTFVSVVCERMLTIVKSDFVCSNCTIASVNSITDEDRVVINVVPNTGVPSFSTAFTKQFENLYSVSASALTVAVDLTSSVAPVNISSITTKSSSTCYLLQECILSSFTSVYQIRAICSNRVYSASYNWLNVDSIVYKTTEEYTSQPIAYVLIPYGQTKTISFNSGVFYDTTGFLETSGSIVIEAKQSPLSVILSISEEGTSSMSVRLRALFSSPCVTSDVGADSLQLQGTCVGYTPVLVEKTSYYAMFSVTTTSSCYMDATFKGGVVRPSVTSGKHSLNVASNTQRINFVAPSFGITSTLDSIPSIYSKEVTFRLFAEGTINAIHKEDVITTNCGIDSFVVGSITPNTVVDIRITIAQEGDFSLQIPEGELTIDSGATNRLWMITVEYVVEKETPTVSIHQLQNLQYINEPLIVDVTFSLFVSVFNATCIETTNLSDLIITDYNPYFVIQAFPVKEGTITIQVKKDCVETASHLNRFPESEVITAFFDPFSPLIEFSFPDDTYLVRSIPLILCMSEKTNINEVYGDIECVSCRITSVVVVSDFIHILNIEFIDEETSATLHIAEGMIRDLAGNELQSSVNVSFTYNKEDSVTLEPASMETRAVPIQFHLTIPEMSFSISGHAVTSEQNRYEVSCYSLDVEQQVIDFSIDIDIIKAIIVSVRPSEPSYVMCSVQYFKKGVYVGRINSVARYVSFALEGHITANYLPSTNPITDLFLVDHILEVTVGFNQVISNCYENLFELSSLTIAESRLVINTPFSSSCVLRVESDISGYKSIKINRNVIESRAGGTNENDLVLNVILEKSRPSLILFDTTPFKDVFSNDRSVIAVFSRDISYLQVSQVCCEDGVVLDLKRIGTRLFIFHVSPSKPLNPSITVRCFIPENAVIDDSGIGNVRSIPLDLLMYSPSSFAISLVSPQYPYTNNNTVTCYLYSSLKLASITKDDFLVKNGYIIDVASEGEAAGNIFRYQVLVRPTVQGSFCIDVSPGTLLSLVNHSWNDVSATLCINHDSLQPYLLSSSPSFRSTNSESVWFSFEFSEPILLLYDPALSLVENLQLLTKERLLSTICAVGTTGDCISIVNGSVKDVSVSSDRLSFLIKSNGGGLLSIFIPTSLITDLSGNRLRESIHHNVYVGPSSLSLIRTTTVAFSTNRIAPMVLLRFSNPMSVSEKADSSSIAVYKDNSVSSLNRSDIIIIGPNVLIPFDTMYSSLSSYTIRIPPGYLRDTYSNYFQGYKDEELTVTSTSLFPLSSLELLSQSFVLIGAVNLFVGAVSAFAGYKNLYNAIIFNNVIPIFLILSIIVYLVFCSTVQTWSTIFLILLSVLIYLISAIISVLFIRYSSDGTLRLFTVGIGLAVGHLICKFICEGFLAINGYINMFSFYLLIVILVVIIIAFTFVPLKTQSHFILSLCFYGSYLVVDGILILIYGWNRKDVFLIGSSENFYVDSVSCVIIVILTVVTYAFQKKYFSSEQYHQYIFGFKVGDGRFGKERDLSAIVSKKKKKAKKEEKSKCKVCGKKLENGQNICESCKIVSV